MARLTPRRLETVRRLRDRFQIIAVIESFLPEVQTTLLRSVLRTRRLVRLGRLGLAATRAYFEECSRRHGFGWSPARIRELALSAAGYPLGMRELVAAEVGRLGRSSHPSRV